MIQLQNLIKRLNVSRCSITYWQRIFSVNLQSGKLLAGILTFFLLFVTAAVVPVSACSDYVHLWRPVNEVRSTLCSAEGLSLFINGMVERVSTGKATWLVGLSPDANVSASFTCELKRAVGLLDPAKFSWVESDRMFAGGIASQSAIWLDFVDPERMVYLWRDENRPPFAMFRTGEIDTARIRVLVMSADRKVLLIDELAYIFLLESDFMLPAWTTTGGIWFRRVSLKTYAMSQRHEWTLSVPSDQEDINSTPGDIRRFFYSNLPDAGSKIISNY